MSDHSGSNGARQGAVSAVSEAESFPLSVIKGEHLWWKINYFRIEKM